MKETSYAGIKFYERQIRYLSGSSDTLVKDVYCKSLQDLCSLLEANLFNKHIHQGDEIELTHWIINSLDDVDVSFDQDESEYDQVYECTLFYKRSL